MPILGGVNSKSLVYNSFNLDEELTKVNPVDALTSGKIKKSDIGKIVYLSNSNTNRHGACQEWRIADINHDGTEGTVDLVSRYVVYDILATTFNSKEDDKWMVWYESSNVKKLLLDFYNDFADNIKNAIKTQHVTLTDPNGTLAYRDYKIKCPSLTELGCRANYAGGALISDMPEEGSIYPLFGDKQVQPNVLAIFKNARTNTPESYWTRTPCNNHSSYGYRVIAIDSNGYFQLEPPNNGYLAACSIIGIIRF